MKNQLFLTVLTLRYRWVFNG